MNGARRSRRRRRFGSPLAAVLLSLMAAVAALIVLAVAAATNGGHNRIASTAPPAGPDTVAARSAPKLRQRSVPRRIDGPKPQPRPIRAEVRTITLRSTDPQRTMPAGGGRVPRSFTTIVRYPVGPPGPFPLIVFGHGFAVSPAPYAALLDAWTRAGYVVAAPVFPLENAAAPGGPNENDLPNQPADMSLVIDDMLAVDRASGGPLAGLIDTRHIAVSGQSDGGDTALAVAFDSRVSDPRVTAAVILSGAQDPFISGFSMPDNHVALLATQGTADTINPPPQTYSFYDAASPPKYLLKLLGAGHQPPYTEAGPELSAVERTTLAFLGCYLKERCRGLQHYLAAGTAGPPSVLSGQPG